MRDLHEGSSNGDIMDIFNVAVQFPAPTEHQEIVGAFELATITIGYALASINNCVCSSSPITTTAEGKCR